MGDISPISPIARFTVQVHNGENYYIVGLNAVKNSVREAIGQTTAYFASMYSICASGWKSNFIGEIVHGRVL